jgi:hypothetical protein
MVRKVLLAPPAQLVLLELMVRKAQQEPMEPTEQMVLLALLAIKVYKV